MIRSYDCERARAVELAAVGLYPCARTRPPCRTQLIYHTLRLRNRVISWAPSAQEQRQYVPN